MSFSDHSHAIPSPLVVATATEGRVGLGCSETCANRKPARSTIEDTGPDVFLSSCFIFYFHVGCEHSIEPYMKRLFGSSRFKWHISRLCESRISDIAVTFFAGYPRLDSILCCPILSLTFLLHRWSPFLLSVLSDTKQSTLSFMPNPIKVETSFHRHILVKSD